MVATGIPPLHVFMHEVSKQNSAQAAHNAAQTLHNTEMLEAVKAVRNVNIEQQPHNVILNMILEKIDNMQSNLNTETANNHLAIAAPVPQVIPETAPTTIPPVPATLYFYNGKFRKIPQSYNIVWNVPLRTMHDLYHQGIPSENICAFRFLVADDVGTVGIRYLNVMKNLVTEINRFLPTTYNTSTYAEKNLCFGKAFSEMADAFLVDNPGQKSRAHEKLSIIALYNKFYLPAKSKRAA